jgi:nucleoside-diphosphate-sugar epimerase
MILVTGATGFVGSELISQLLLKGEKIRAIKRITSRIPQFLADKKDLEWFDADILDYFALSNAMDGISCVYHCAALISFQSKDKKEMLKVNVEGTANLLNVCMEKNIGRFLHVSSIAAIGESKKAMLITEKDHWELVSGQSAYSVSKYKSEMEVFRAAAEGLHVVIVNPTIIIGKNAGKEGSGQLFESIRTGLNYFPGGSSGYVDVVDVAKIMILLMESNIRDERYIINSENLSYKEFFSKIALNFGKKSPSVALKPWMMYLAWLGSKIITPITGKRFGLSLETVRSAFKKHQYSNEKIKKTLNFNFKPLDESISEICLNLKNT